MHKYYKGYGPSNYWYLRGTYVKQIIGKPALERAGYTSLLDVSIAR